MGDNQSQPSKLSSAFDAARFPAIGQIHKPGFCNFSAAADGNQNHRIDLNASVNNESTFLRAIVISPPVPHGFPGQV